MCLVGMNIIIKIMTNIILSLLSCNIRNILYMQCSIMLKRLSSFLTLGKSYQELLKLSNQLSTLYYLSEMNFKRTIMTLMISNNMNNIIFIILYQNLSGNIMILNYSPSIIMTLNLSMLNNVIINDLINSIKFVIFIY